jgi:solute carrier family 25 (mitochondrial phosphate transporter), member 3
MMAEGGWPLFYKGLVPLWFRQIPYTIVKFVAFEKTVRAFYANVFTAPRDTYSKSTQLMITFMSGYWAGIFCAIVSHPADTMVSIMNKRGGTAGEIYSQIGFSGLWSGLGARIFMIGTLTGLQWWIYDTFKVACGLQASGK